MEDLLDDNERDYQLLGPLNIAVKEWGWCLAFLAAALGLSIFLGILGLALWLIGYLPTLIKSSNWMFVFSILTIIVFSFRLMRQHNQTSKDVTEYLESALMHDFELVVRSGFNGWYWWFLLLLTTTILVTTTLGRSLYNQFDTATQKVEKAKEETTEAERTIPMEEAIESMEGEAVEEQPAED